MNNKKENHWKWNGGKSKCLICNKQLKHYGKYCIICWSKTITGKNSPNYKHGKLLKENSYCLDCSKKISIRAIRCRKCANSKKNHPNWKNGITPLSEQIRKIDEYKTWRIFIFERDNYTCQKCNKRGIKLEVHHIKPFSIILKEFLKKYNQFSPFEDKEILLRLSLTYDDFWNINNGETKCLKCHKNGHPKHCKPLKKR